MSTWEHLLVPVVVEKTVSVIYPVNRPELFRLIGITYNLAIIQEGNVSYLSNKQVIRITYKLQQAKTVSLFI
jgi:hypothetical protein